MQSQLEPFEIKGQWWRPDGTDLVKEKPDELRPGTFRIEDGIALLQSDRDKKGGTSYEHACRGTLEFDPSSGFRLELLGLSEAAFPTSGEPFTMFGESSKGRPCTLLGCFVLNAHSQLMGGGIAERSIHVGTLVQGEHIQSEEEFHFDHLELRVANLVSFLWGGSSLLRPGEKTEPNLVHETVFDGARVTFEVGEKVTSSIHSSRWEREAIVAIRLDEEIEWSVWKEKWIQPLARLLTLATGRPATVESTSSIVTETIEPGPASPSGSSRKIAHEIVQPQRLFDHKKPFERHRLLFSYSSLGSRFDPLLETWLRLNRDLAGTGDFLFGALEPSQTLETQLVTFGSVMESYHRAFLDDNQISNGEHEEIVAKMCAAVADESTRDLYASRLKHANERTQRERIQGVLARAGQAIGPLGVKTGRLTHAVVETRNYFVHLGERSDSVLELDELWEANTLLAAALKANLLLDLGVPASDIEDGLQGAMTGHPVWEKLYRRGSAWPKARATSDG